MRRAEHADHNPPQQTRVRDIIAAIKDGHASLTRAEKAVADAVLADVQAAVDAPNGELARRAGVSQPTVTRFCRSIGCDGVRDFKLQLARSLVVGELYLAPTAPPKRADGPERPPWWLSVFGEARAALSAVETQLTPDDLQRAADLLARAGRVVVFGLGGSSAALAEETQYRLFRYGVGITALKDPWIARMQAATFKPGDVVIAISATGRTREVIETVDLVRHYGASAIAITAPGTDLARAADVALTARVPEFPDTLTPSASRFAFLAVIDLMAAATGYRLGPSAQENLRRIKYAVLSRRPGAVLEPLGD
jgi:DNA-binding MurR/RpiR family transcriptional regulator